MYVVLLGVHTRVHRSLYAQCRSGALQVMHICIICVVKLGVTDTLLAWRLANHNESCHGRNIILTDDLNSPPRTDRRVRANLNNQKFFKKIATDRHAFPRESRSVFDHNRKYDVK